MPDSGPPLHVRLAEAINTACPPLSKAAVKITKAINGTKPATLAVLLLRLGTAVFPILVVLMCLAWPIPKGTTVDHDIQMCVRPCLSLRFCCLSLPFTGGLLLSFDHAGRFELGKKEHRLLLKKLLAAHAGAVLAFIGCPSHPQSTADSLLLAASLVRLWIRHVCSEVEWTGSIVSLVPQLAPSLSHTSAGVPIRILSRRRQSARKVSVLALI